MGELSGKKIVMVVAPKDFRDEEYFQPKVMLQAIGVEIVTAAKSDEEEATGVQGGKAKIDLNLKDIKTKDYEGIIFIGGQGAKVYFQDKIILKLAKEFFKAGKVVAAICIAPSILANADILKGKRVTAFPSEEKNLIKHQAILTNKPVEVDGTIVTAKNSEVALEFGQKLVEVLTSQ